MLKSHLFGIIYTRIWIDLLWLYITTRENQIEIKYNTWVKPLNITAEHIENNRFTVLIYSIN